MNVLQRIKALEIIVEELKPKKYKHGRKILKNDEEILKQLNDLENRLSKLEQQMGSNE